MKHHTNDLPNEPVDFDTDRNSGLVDESALKRLRDGDPEVLGELFDRYRQRLLHIIQIRMDRRLAARVDAEDILQEIYLDAASRVHHYIQNHSGSFFIWLRLITTQTMANIEQILVAAGSTLEHLAKCIVYLVDMGDFDWGRDA